MAMEMMAMDVKVQTRKKLTNDTIIDRNKQKFLHHWIKNFQCCEEQIEMIKYL